MPARVLVILAAGALVVAAAAAVFFTFQPDEPGSDAAVGPPGAEASRPGSPAEPGSEPSPPAPTPAAPRPDRPSPRPEAPPETGTLRIESDVPDTSVFINRKFVGTAPVMVSDLPPGQHTVLLSPSGFDSHSETVDVRAGSQAYSHRFKEIRLDAQTPVVHKHRIGSCRGTLRATPAGLRYDTTHESDGFTAALGDLETFEVDYLGNNLRVRIRGGGTFNFEDPDGDRDRLFVFHRDVDEVRQRIIGRRR